jgi:phosphopantothenoylcysteine decarboxylase / phosphopantothenate---cysteine ligase
MKRMRILITAGGTQEAIDPVRFLSNGSSGRMGVSLARVAQRMWHEVTLISAPTVLKPSTGVKVIQVVSAADMFEAVKKQYDRCDCLIMAAAVSDYAPTKASRTKIHKGQDELIVRCKPTVDILAWAGKHKEGQILVGFVLEDDDLRQRAEEKMAAKNLDMVIANTPQAIGQMRAEVHIKNGKRPWIRFESTKQLIASKIIRTVEQIAEMREMIGLAGG